jgi:hypothetical protein
MSWNSRKSRAMKPTRRQESPQNHDGRLEMQLKSMGGHRHRSQNLLPPLVPVDGETERQERRACAQETKQRKSPFRRRNKKLRMGRGMCQTCPPRFLSRVDWTQNPVAPEPAVEKMAEGEDGKGLGKRRCRNHRSRTFIPR